MQVHPGSDSFSTSPKITINQLPLTLLENIFNFLKLNKIAAQAHFVCSNWRHVRQNDRHLVLSDLKINTLALRQILDQYKDRTIVSIDFSRCQQIVNEDLIFISKIPSLKALNLYGTNTDNNGLVHLSSLSLERLNLGLCTEVTDDGMTYLSKMPLKELNLSQCGKITNKCLIYLSDLALTKCQLDWNKHSTDTDLVFLRKMPLTELRLTNVELTDKGIRQISQWPLKKLYFDFMSLGDAELGMLPSSLTHLSLDHSINFTASGVQTLSRLTSLTYLDLFGCMQVTDEHLKSLSTLNINALILTSKEITDAGLNYLKPTLKYLRLMLCEKITNRGLEILSKHPLEYLSLWACSKISDTGIEFVSTLPLRHLILKGSPLLTNNCLVSISNLRLIQLDLSGCPGITDSAKHSKFPDFEGPPVDFLKVLSK